MSDFHDQLKGHLSSFHTLPYLFVGSGLSRRYLGIPTWTDLLKAFYPQLQQTEFPFEYHLSLCNGDLPKLAGDFANAFHRIWWSDHRYEDSRRQYETIAGLDIDIPFKIELCKLVANYKQRDGQYTKEIDLLKNASLAGVITTNWDTFLSDIFVEFQTYIGQHELFFANNIYIGDIYKIHGGVTKPQSLVVTSADYKVFNDKNPYLASKLLTIFVEHPVIFLGYSLTDENIRTIIESIVDCLDRTNINKLQDRLVFVDWSPTATEPKMSDNVFMAGKSVLPIKLVQTASFEPVYTVLNELQQRIPIKILRKLKASIYDLLTTEKPTKIMYVGELEEIEQNQNIDFVVGIGLAKQIATDKGEPLHVFGYHAPDVKDIIKDILMDEMHYDAKLLIKETFPKLLRGNGYCPCFKYLRQAGFLTKDGQLNRTGKTQIGTTFVIKENVPACFGPGKQYKNKIAEVTKKYKSLAELRAGEKPANALLFVPVFDASFFDLGDLRNYLIECLNDNALNKTTQFRKAVCYFDYLTSFKEAGSEA